MPVKPILIAALLALAAAPALAADGECQKAKISCSEAKAQNLEYCASQRRVDSGMTQEGCLKSGERAMAECLRTGKWVTGRRNLCELTRQ